VDEEKLYHGLSMLKKQTCANEVVETIMNIIPTYKSARLQYGTEKNNIVIEDHYSKGDERYQEATTAVR